MEFLGIGKITKDDKGVVTERRYIVEMTEAEADMITGVAGKAHISGRYKPGVDVNIAVIYQKVKQINEKQDEIVAAAKELQSDAADMENAIPLTGE